MKHDFMTMRTLFILCSLLAATSSLHASSLSDLEFEECPQKPSITLEEAKEKTFAASPAIKTAGALVQAKLGTAWQAGLYINPAVGLEFDNLGCGKSCRWSSEASASVTLSQMFELGGKRTARQNLAFAEVHLAMMDKAILEAEILEKLTDAFISAAEAQEKKKLKGLQLKNAEKSLECVLGKVKNGRSSVIQQKKSEITYNTALIAFQKAESELNSAKRALSAFWGDAFPKFETIEYPFYDISPPKPFPEIAALLENNAEVVRGQLAIYAAQNEYALQRSQRIPDLEISAGYYYENDDSCRNSLTLEFNFAIPVFNRNQGNICRAAWQIQQTIHEKEETVLQKSTLLADVYQKWKQIAEMAGKVQNSSLQNAKAALEEVEEGYNQGKFECQDYLDAKENLFEVQNQLIELFYEYHYLKNKMKRLAPSECWWEVTPKHVENLVLD